MKKASKKTSEKSAEESRTARAGGEGPKRLDKLLGQEGLGTRSELKKAIRSGRATVNGAVEKDPGRQISSEDEVCFDGKRIRRDQYVYYMLNKPAGVITATEDGQMRTVLDLLREPGMFARGTARETDMPRKTGAVPAADTGARTPLADTGTKTPDADSGGNAPLADKTPAPDTGAAESPVVPAKTLAGREPVRPVMRKGLFPVGRLDRDTEGLLLITDDGQLAHRLLSPARHVDKTYYAVVTGTVTEEDIRLFAEGLRVDAGFTAMPAVLRIIENESCSEAPGKYSLPEIADGRQYTQVYVTIREGKFHQIKRMFAAVGKEVLYLKRLSMGRLKLDSSLEPGQFRELTEEETADLREH